MHQYEPQNTNGLAVEPASAPHPELTGQALDTITPREQVMQRFGRRTLLSNLGMTGMFFLLNVIMCYIVVPFQSGRTAGFQKNAILLMNLLGLFAMIGSSLWYLRHPGLPPRASREGKVALGVALASMLPVLAVWFGQDALQLLIITYNRLF